MSWAADGQDGNGCNFNKIGLFFLSLSRKLDRYNSFIIQHIDNKTKFEEKILSLSFLFLHSLVKMLKFKPIVGYTSCGPT